MAIYNGLIALPWCLKVFYGITSDNLPICGLRRKPYLIIFSFVQFVVMFDLFYFDHDNPIEVTLLLMIGSTSMAFSNVVVDAIMIVQSRRDLELGSQDLLSLAFLFQAVGGVVGCLLAAIMTERFHPRWSFLTYSLYGYFLFIASLFLSKEAEEEPPHDNHPLASDISSDLTLENDTVSSYTAGRPDHEVAETKLSFGYRFKRNMILIGRALKRKEIYMLIFYFLLDGLTSPSFQDF